MSTPVFVFVGTANPIQKILPALAADSRIKIAAVFGIEKDDKATSQLCTRHGIKFYDMAVLKTNEGVSILKQLNPDWLLNINSMILYKDDILSIPKKGALNLHCGNLPEYAGKHAHQWAIRNGEKKFGATIHWMSLTPDAGDIVSIKYFSIEENDTGLSLYLKFVKEGSAMVMDLINDIASRKQIQKIKQDTSRRKYYLEKQAMDGCIKWNNKAEEIVNFVRAADYSPFKSPTYVPFSVYDGVKVYISKVKVLHETSDKPGLIEAVSEGGIVVNTGNEKIVLTKYHIEQGKSVRIVPGNYFDLK